MKSLPTTRRRNVFVMPVSHAPSSDPLTYSRIALAVSFTARWVVVPRAVVINGFTVPDVPADASVQEAATLPVPRWSRVSVDPSAAYSVTMSDTPASVVLTNTDSHTFPTARSTATWTSQLAAEGLSESYVYALHGRLSQLFSDAVHDGIVAKSPCSRRTSPGAGKQRAYVATTEQVWALHDAFPEHLRSAVLLGAFAGLRLAEACGMRVSDVDFIRGIVSPAVQYPADPLKSETSRTAVPIPASMALQLAAHVKRWRSETVLTNELGRQLAPWVLERAMRAARAKVPGLPADFRYHDLRHYFASLLISSGADVKVVQARLRHASAKTTLDTYGHLWPDSDDSTRAAIEAVMAARAETLADNLRTEGGG